MATKKKSTQRKSSAGKASAKKKSTAKKVSPAKGKGKAKQKPAPRAAAAGPRPVGTGKGASPLEIGKSLVEMVRTGRSSEVEKKWWAPGLVSVEGVGMAMEWAGRKAVLSKYKAWEADHVIHSADVEGPFVGATGFTVGFKIDVTTTSTGQRDRMEEVGVYTVKGGKIVREEFMYRVG